MTLRSENENISGIVHRRHVARVKTLFALVAVVTSMPTESSAQATNLFAGGTLAGEPHIWCGARTPIVKNAAHGIFAASGCPIAGPPDIPANRDACIPTSKTPIQWLRMKITTFANDDGIEPLKTQEDIDAQMEQLNADLAPWRIQFVYHSEIINASRYRIVDNVHRYDEIQEMMGATGEQPDRQLNVFVTLVHDFIGLLGFATLPWEDDALQSKGGIWVHAGSFGEGELVLTHEVGHSLGLYHTFAGVSE